MKETLGSLPRFLRFLATMPDAQSLVLASKVSALLDRRINLSFEDIRANIKQMQIGRAHV